MPGQPRRINFAFQFIIPISALISLFACVPAQSSKDASRVPSTPATLANVALPITPSETAVESPTPTDTPQPATLATTPVTPVIATTGDVRVFIIGYAASACGPHRCEHIHLFNCDSNPINMAGWKLKSVATGDVFTFPTFLANPGCSQQVQFTVNTHRVGNEDAAAGIFTWDQPLSVEEWSPRGGKVELEDATGNKITACFYAPTPILDDVLCR